MSLWSFKSLKIFRITHKQQPTRRNSISICKYPIEIHTSRLLAAHFIAFPLYVAWFNLFFPSLEKSVINSWWLLLELLCPDKMTNVADWEKSHSSLQAFLFFLRFYSTQHCTSKSVCCLSFRIKSVNKGFIYWPKKNIFYILTWA